jgi:hypothetical protein
MKETDYGKMYSAAPRMYRALLNAAIVMQNAVDFAMAGIEEGQVIPKAIDRLEDELRFVKAALREAGAQL